MGNICGKDTPDITLTCINSGVISSCIQPHKKEEEVEEEDEKKEHEISEEDFRKSLSNYIEMYLRTRRTYHSSTMKNFENVSNYTELTSNKRELIIYERTRIDKNGHSKLILRWEKVKQ